MICFTATSSAARMPWKPLNSEYLQPPPPQQQQQKQQQDRCAQ
jgi:hypothetical protein